jgi:hypothetical protein
MNSVKPILSILLSFSSFILFAQEDEAKIKKIELNGYIKDLQSVYFVNRIDSLTSVNLLHNRLNFKMNLLKHLSGRLEIRNRIFYGDQLKQIPEFGTIINQYNGFFNLSKLWVNKKTLVVHSVIDRMLIQYSTEKWDVKAGRQRINWGINNIWNPNDIFNAYNFLDFDYEERPGNDALRIQHYFQNNSTLELAIKPGKNKNESIGALLYKFNKKKYDIQLLGGIYQNDLVIGGGWAGSIKEAGFKGELSYFHPRKNLFDTSGILSFSLMTDQTFKNDWYASFSVLFNSNPSNMTGNSANLFSSNLSAKELFPYRYTFYAGIIKSFTPVRSLNVSVIYSPEKNSLILFPSWAWNVAQNFGLDITAQAFFAKGLNRYQSQGNAIYVRGKWSF